MKQNQFSPMSISQMAVSLYAANAGFLDDVDPSKVVDFEAALQDYMMSHEKDLMDEIDSSGNYDSKIEEALKKAIESFKSTSTW